ncbi:MAG TPA: hypothetical protein VL486_08590 [Verrucomicrobiae bacterium]|nr:hypothetical protein [Verrucomicrobiae bacterium]
MPKPALEKDLYEIVRRYLTKERGCVTASFNSRGKQIPYVNRGHGQLIVDVYGLSGVRDTHSRKLEGIAVEVKRKKTSTPRRYIAQAEQYSHLAHRCYLAQPFDFTDKTKIEAARTGVGLLLIKGREVELVSESRLFSPSPDDFDSFLNNSLQIRQCAICGCYQFRYAHRAADSDAGGSHWRRDDIAPSPPKKNKRTYLCAECEHRWAPGSDFKKLEKQVARLKNQIAKLRNALKR